MKLRKKLLSTLLTTLLLVTPLTAEAAYTIPGEVNGVARYIPSGQNLNIPGEALESIRRGDYYVAEVKIHLYLPIYSTKGRYDSYNTYYLPFIRFYMATGSSAIVDAQFRGSWQNAAVIGGGNYHTLPIISNGGSLPFSGGTALNGTSWVNFPRNYVVVQAAHFGMWPGQFQIDQPLSMWTQVTHEAQGQVWTDDSYYNPTSIRNFTHSDPGNFSTPNWSYANTSYIVVAKNPYSPTTILDNQIKEVQNTISTLPTTLNNAITQMQNTMNSKINGIINVPVGNTSILAKYGLSTTITTDGIYAAPDGNRYKVVFYNLPTSIAQLNLS